MSKYFSANGGLGLGALFNQFYSDRSDGKTFDIVYRGLKRFDKYNYITVYMRRWKTEFTKVMIDTFIDDVKNKKKDEMMFIKDVKSDKTGVQIKKEDGIWRYAFYFVPLTMAQKLKSSFNPENIREIDFDEYVPLDGRYAPEEMFNILEFWNTCDRKRNIVKFCTFGNRITASNPFLNFFGVEIKIDDKFKTRLYKNGQLMVNIYHNEENRKEVEESPFMDLIKGTQYENYMRGNVLMSSTAIYKDKPKDATVWSSFKTNLGEGTIWNYNDLYFVSDKVNFSCGQCITDRPYIIKDCECYVATIAEISSFIKSIYRNTKLFATNFNAWKIFEPIIDLVNVR